MGGGSSSCKGDSSDPAAHTQAADEAAKKAQQEAQERAQRAEEALKAAAAEAQRKADAAAAAAAAERRRAAEAAAAERRRAEEAARKQQAEMQAQAQRHAAALEAAKRENEQRERELQATLARDKAASEQQVREQTERALAAAAAQVAAERKLREAEQAAEQAMRDAEERERAIKRVADAKAQADAQRVLAAEQRAAAEQEIANELKAEAEDARRKTAFLVRDFIIPTEDARRRLGLDTSKVNVAITGQTSSGKSYIINSYFLGVGPRHQSAAPVHARECTMKRTKYEITLRGGYDLYVHDLPGAGTPQFPVDTYFTEMRLDCYDVVLVVTSGFFSEFDLRVIAHLQDAGVPYFLVRNKIDCDIADGERDLEMNADEVIADVRAAMESNPHIPDGKPVYLISALRNNLNKFDGPALMEDVKNKALERFGSVGAGLAKATAGRSVEQLRAAAGAVTGDGGGGAASPPHATAEAIARGGSEPATEEAEARSKAAAGAAAGAGADPAVAIAVTGDSTTSKGDRKAPDASEDTGPGDAASTRAESKLAADSEAARADVTSPAATLTLDDVVVIAGVVDSDATTSGNADVSAEDSKGAGDA